MPTPWTKEEEKQLIKSIKENKSFDELAKIHNRSISALMMRYNKIVFDNLEAGKSKQELAKILKTTTDKITQAYYEHKSFLEKKELTSKKVADKSFEKQTKVLTSEKSVKPLINKSDKLKSLERENQILKKIIENIRMKQKLGEVIGKKELVKKILEIIKKH